MVRLLTIFILKDLQNLSRMTMKDKLFLVVISMKVKDSSLQLSFGNRKRPQLWCNNKSLAQFCQFLFIQILMKLLMRLIQETNLWLFIIFLIIQKSCKKFKTVQAQEHLLSMILSVKCWIHNFLLEVLVRVVMDDSMGNQDLRDSAIQRVFVKQNLWTITHWTWDSHLTLNQTKNSCKNC